MTALPSLPDLANAGVTTEDFIARLTQYIGPRSTSIWVVRWDGRIRAIRGIAFFTSRESARNEVIKWLRDSGRSALLRHHDIVRQLPRNWGHKKSYRRFIEQLLSLFEETGRLEYIELQASTSGAPQPSDSTRTLIG